jgi:hypothetical protein
MTPFCRGLKNIWSGAENTKRSKKSQPLRMTTLLGSLQYSWLDMQEHERSKKSQALGEGQEAGSF